jgi:hypothetical protein
MSTILKDLAKPITAAFILANAPGVVPERANVSSFNALTDAFDAAIAAV